MEAGRMPSAREDLLEERARVLAENYSAEADLLEKVVAHMERERGLIQAGDFAALRDSLAGRGEIIDEIARIEAERRELETQYASLLAQRGGGDVDPASRDASSGPAEEAKRRATAIHRRARQMDEELREMLRIRRVELEKALSGLAHARTANRAYSNGKARYGTASVFLDKER